MKKNKEKIWYNITIISMYIGIFTFVILNKYESDFCIIGLGLMLFSIILMIIYLIKEFIQYLTK